MDLQNSVILLLIGQIVTIVVLLVSNYINRKHSSQLLQDEIHTRKRVEYLEKQLTEFYGPIYTLLAMNRSIAQVHRNIETDELSQKLPKDMWDDLRDNVIMPNNKDIIDIIKNHFHLIEGIDIPTHLRDFLVHAQVWSFSYKYNLDKSVYLNNFRFPPDFWDYIVSTTEAIKQEYYSLLAGDINLQKYKQ